MPRAECRWRRGAALALVLSCGLGAPGAAQIIVPVQRQDRVDVSVEVEVDGEVLNVQSPRGERDRDALTFFVE